VAPSGRADAWREWDGQLSELPSRLLVLFIPEYQSSEEKPDRRTISVAQEYLSQAFVRFDVVEHYLGHKNIMHTVRYTELSPERFRDFWED